MSIKLLSNLGLLVLLSYLILFQSCDRSTTYPQGKRLYEFHCSNCHMSDGSGLVNVYPPLRKADYLQNNIDLLPCIMRHGIKDTIEVNGMTYSIEMEGNSSLSNAEITNIANYIFTAWDNQLPETTIKEIEKNLLNCK